MRKFGGIFSSPVARDCYGHKLRANICRDLECNLSGNKHDRRSTPLAGIPVLALSRGKSAGGMNLYKVEHVLILENAEVCILFRLLLYLTR